MAKLVILALSFTAIVAFAEVSAKTTTTITTTILEDENQGSWGQGQCSRQVQGQEVSHCQMHIVRGSQGVPDNEFIRMPVENQKQKKEQPHLQLCCEQLRNVEQECQCDAINQAFQQARSETQQQQGGSSQGQGPTMEKMMRRAGKIANKCNLQIQQCQIQGQWF